MTVSWAYGGVSSVQIPTANQILTPLAESSPYTFNVVSEIWGDGFTTSTETCDDGNTINGDGCSSTWTVEDNSFWINSSSSTTSVCQICILYWTPNSSKTKCITDEITPGIVSFSAFYNNLILKYIFYIKYKI